MSGVIGSGVPVGTPREDWREFGYETRCASVVQVSDFAIRRVKPVSLPIVLGSTFELEDCAHGARLHEKKEQATTATVQTQEAHRQPVSRVPCRPRPRQRSRTPTPTATCTAGGARPPMRAPRASWRL